MRLRVANVCAWNTRRPMRYRVAVFLGPVAFIAWSSGLAAQEVPATRASGAIQIDGVLDEADWSSAAAIETFTQLQPVAGAPASQRTVIRVLYDERMVYFGIEGRDTNPDAISRTVTQRDGEVWEDDAVALVLDTFDDDNNAYVFMVNSLGTQQDERWADNGRTRDITWDANWLSAGATSDRGWTAEVAIPFETVRFAREATAWGFNAIRYLPRNLEQSHWVPGLSEWFRIDEIGSHHRPRSDRGRHQELRLHPLPAGGPPGGAGRHHGVRTRSALRAVQQHRDRLLLQSGLRHRRGRRRAGEPDALRAVVPGKAPLLPGRHGELSDPHRAVLLPPDRRHAVGREGQREGRQVESQRAGQPDGLGVRHLERRDRARSTPRSG